MPRKRPPAVRYPELGNWLRARRQELRLSQRAVASQCQVGPTVISKLESGQDRASPYVAPKLAVILNVPEDEIHVRGGRIPDHFLKAIVKDPLGALEVLREFSERG